MACMEHVCLVCDTSVFNNEGSGGKCPKCGAHQWMSTCDEDLDRGVDVSADLAADILRDERNREWDEFNHSGMEY